MNEFAELFTEGGHKNSLGRAAEVLQAVLADSSRLDELYACILHEDAWVRMRAIDTFEKVGREHPDWLKPYLNQLLTEVAEIDQPSIQWHLAEIFAEVELKDIQRAQAIKLMKANIKNIDVDWIVSANTMKTLVSFVEDGYMPANEIAPLLELQRSHSSQAVRKRADKLLTEMS